MRHFTILVLLTALGACAETSDDTSDTSDTSDREAETARQQGLDKADAPTFFGLYTTSTTTLAEGDVPDLELISGGTYVRRRCYHSDCSLPVAETDHYDTYKSTSGKTYVRFYGFATQWNTTHDDRTQVPVVVDVYEITTTTTTIHLRKSYTSRWLTLRKTSAATRCTNTGGSWHATTCSCPGDTGWSDTEYVGFVAGAGGCTTIPGVSESECDASGGYYTDDDATLVSTFCQCDRGEYLASDGCTAL
ncbi:MAG: hypothetical protein ABI591_30280 [Kofleriaceae bacterium]